MQSENAMPNGVKSKQIISIQDDLSDGEIQNSYRLSCIRIFKSINDYNQ